MKESITQNIGFLVELLKQINLEHGPYKDTIGNYHPLLTTRMPLSLLGQKQ